MKEHLRPPDDALRQIYFYLHRIPSQDIQPQSNKIEALDKPKLRNNM